MAALLLPISIEDTRGSAQHYPYPATVCVKNVATGEVVHRVALNLTTRNVTSGGWTRIALPAPLPAGSTFDVAMTNADVPAHHSGKTAYCATWLTRTAVLGGGGRIETWGYVHAGMNVSTDDNSCCTQKWSPPVSDTDDGPRTGTPALAPTLASRLEKGMVWQLGLANATPTSATPSGLPFSPRFGVLVVSDAFHNGVPMTGMATCSASSMWDQIRMGWKSMCVL